MKDGARDLDRASQASVFDDQDELMKVMVRSFERAAKAAVAENDRLGIVTHGAVNGVLTERIPPAKPG